MDLKEILNLHHYLFKNKLVGENAVARVHGSCSFLFMGSCHNIIFLPICVGMLAYLRKLVQFFFEFPSMSVNLDPRVTKRNDPAGNKAGLPRSP